MVMALGFVCLLAVGYMVEILYNFQPIIKNKKIIINIIIDEVCSKKHHNQKTMIRNEKLCIQKSEVAIHPESG